MPKQWKKKRRWLRLLNHSLKNGDVAYGFSYSLNLRANTLHISLRPFFFIFLFVATACANAQQRFQYSQPKMGSPFNLIFYAADSATANRLAKESFAFIDSLNTIFSDYLEGSELNRLGLTAGSGRAVVVSPLLLDLLIVSEMAAKKSRHTFDITIGPLSRLWRGVRKEARFPSKEEVSLAKSKTGMQHLLIDSAAKKVTLTKAGMQLDLGGIAKGYVAQKVIGFLRAKGIASALADAGGDLACSQPPPGKKGWTVGINVPESITDMLPQTIEISNRSVATSGDLYQYIEHNGKRYSHIIDPRSGYGVSFRRNVTIVASDGPTADWLATACSILSLRQCKKLANEMKAGLLITQLKDGRVSYRMNKDMKKRLGM